MANTGILSNDIIKAKRHNLFESEIDNRFLGQVLESTI